MPVLNIRWAVGHIWSYSILNSATTHFLHNNANCRRTINRTNYSPATNHSLIRSESVERIKWN